MGNRVLEEGWYDDSPSTNVHKTVLVNDIRGGGGCGSNSGEPKAGEVRYNASDTETSSVQYVHGKGQGSIVQELADNGSAIVYRYRHEDQAGSLIGVTDEDGFRTDEYFYLDFGTPVHRPILFDGGAGEIESITANTPSAGYTRIGLYDDYLTADALIGKQLRALGSLHVGEVYDNGTDTIDVVDPTGDIYTAVYGNLNIVVMDFDAPAVEPVATGTWTDVYYSELDDYTVFQDTGASFSTTVSVGDLIQPDRAQPSVWVTVSSVLSNTELAVDGDVTETSAPLVPYIVTDPIWSYASGVSTYTNNSANFEDWMLGWLFTPDVNEPCYLQVIEVTSATSIKVKGDARGLSQPDDQWRIHAPPGVDNTTGGLHTDLTTSGSRYLYGSMRYMPPQAGFDISGIIQGTQSGVMLSGCYFDGILVDPQSGVAFQDADSDNNSGTPIKSSGRWKLEGKDSDDAGHDRPVGGVRLRWIEDDCDCSMRLNLETSGHSSGTNPVRDALSERVDWVFDNMEEAVPEAADDPDQSGHFAGLGAWKFRRKNADGTKELVGHAFALAIIIMYDCQCQLMMPRWSQQEAKGGMTWVDDNYGSGEGKNDNYKKMKEAKITKNFDGTPREYCYQVWVDSVGSVRSSVDENHKRTIIKSFRGYAIVKHRARDDCWARGVAHWIVESRIRKSKHSADGMKVTGGARWIVPPKITHHKTDPGRPW